MKVKIQTFSSIPVIILTLLLSDLSAQSQCIYTWSPQASGTFSILNSVKAVSPMVAWVAGYNSTVRRTTDGGSTWINANPNPAMIPGNIETIEAIDAMNAWCATSPGTNTFIYKTTNGGNVWTQVYANTSGFINCVQVMEPYIWFGGSTGTVYRSTNLGINWTTAPTPGIAVYVQALHLNSQTGLGLASGTTMDITTNGGISFTPLPVPGAGNISGIEGAGNDLWYLRGENIYRSTNAGANWTVEHNTGITMLAINFTNNSISGCLEGWAVGYAGTVVKMIGLTVGTANNQTSLPETYKLEQNYPNPFNPTTTINYSIPHEGFVKLVVTDILGKQVAVLVNENKPAGNYSVNFDAANIPSGVYFYKIETGDFTAVKKMVVMK